MAGKGVMESELTMAPTYLSGGAALLGEMHPVKKVIADLDEQLWVGSGLDASPYLSWPYPQQHWIIHKLCF